MYQKDQLEVAKILFLQILVLSDSYKKSRIYKSN